MFVKLGVAILFVLAVTLFRIAGAFYGSRRFSAKTKLLTSIGILLGLVGAFTVYPQESAFYKAKRDAVSDPWALCSFKTSYPSSYRIGEVDEMLWQATYGPKADWALYLYKQYFQSGKHTEELKQRLAKKKQDRLTEIRTHPDLKNVRDFLTDYKGDPEADEAREILFDVLERTHAGSKESPPPALLHQLMRSSDSSRITYSVDVAGDTDCPSSAGISSPVGDRLRAAFESLHLQSRAAPGGGSIRARAACVVEQGASYGDKLAHGEIIAVSFAVYLPGNAQPAWIGTVSARSPEKISGLTKDLSHNQGVVTVKTIEELKDSLKPVFRYWE
jgi:hypothetical protein